MNNNVAIVIADNAESTDRLLMSVDIKHDDAAVLSKEEYMNFVQFNSNDSIYLASDANSKLVGKLMQTLAADLQSNQTVNITFVNLK